MVYRVLVVDDEPPFIRSITRLVESFNPQFKVVDHAYNGREALEKIDAQSVDVLITDIKMPVMDGVELLKELQEKKQDIATLIVSGYQDFEYAKAALKAGALDYLLKPIDKTQFAETFEALHAKLKQQHAAMREGLIYDLLNGASVNEKNITRYFDCDGYCAVNVLEGQYLSASHRVYYKGSNTLKKSIAGALEEVGIAGTVDMVELIPGKQYLLLACGDMDVSGAVKALEALDFTLNIVCSERFNDIWLLPNVLEKLDRCLQYRVVIGKKGLFCLSDEDAETAKITGLDSLTVSKLDTLIQSQSFELLAKEISKLYLTWEQMEYGQRSIEKLSNQLVHLIQRRFPEKFVTDFEHDLYYLIASAESLAIISSAMQWLVFEISGKREKPTSLAEDIMRKADQYIQKNLDGNISLQMACESLNVSQPYLSRIVRSFRDQSFNEYVTGIRIGKAREIMDDSPEILVKDVASIVGYEDQHYFSKVFKLVVGQSPTEYKSKNI